ERSSPLVLTTSQKLSTGVDARNVRNIVLLRPVNSMIEFKQIVGRGTRLYDGKDFFTIYDFVKAHMHVRDPEWDGEPLEPEPPRTPGEGEPYPEPKPEEPVADPPGAEEPRRIIRVKLADGKVRRIQHMAQTTFWNADGVLVSAEEFIRLLFGELPTLFRSEEELRALWSPPATRAQLLGELAEKGFPQEQLRELQRIIDAEQCDLYDVLAYIAYSRDVQLRERRAAQARTHFAEYDDQQRAFLDFVLQQYVRTGVEELQ